MAMHSIHPGLRSMVNDSSGTTKVQLTLQPGDELAVSDGVAFQLASQSAALKPADGNPVEKPSAAEVEDPEVVAESEPKAATKKSAAKK